MALRTIRSRALTAVLACTLAMPAAAPAFAWGEKEQNALLGLGALTAGALIWREANKPQNPRPQPPAPLPVAQPASIYHTPTAQAFNRYSYAERRTIQTNLARWGYYRGGIDGAFGPGTYTAITTYARASSESDRLATSAGAFAVLDGVLF